MKKQRFVLMLGLSAVVLVIAVGLLRTREPQHQGKRLNVWWDEFNNRQPASPAEWEAGWSEFTNLVHSVGTNALPFYLSCLSDKPPPKWRDKLDDWLRDKTSGRVRLPQPRNRIMEAQASIEILGPAAAAAIPKLARLLSDDYSSWSAAQCLSTIGPSALPTLSNAVVTASSSRIRYRALEALGSMGSDAQPASPMLLKIIQKNEPAADFSLADLSLRVLMESETNAAERMPLLVECLANTNTAPGAAFGLARLGTPGTLVLLEAITNKTDKIRVAAATALAMDFQKYHAYPMARFNRISASFNSRMRGFQWSLYSGNEFLRMESVLRRYFTNENEQIRMSATNALYYLKPLSTNAPPIPHSEPPG